MGNKTTEMLCKEYLELNKARFDRMFGHNAEKEQSLVAQELLARGVTHIPNIFGSIEVRA